MTAGAALQAAIVAAVSGQIELTGTFDGPPARADYPYLIIDCSTERDRSCQSYVGRELEIELTLWDDQPKRLLDVEGALERRMSQTLAVADWELASLRFASKKKVRNPVGPWSCTLSYRAFMMTRMWGEPS